MPKAQPGNPQDKPTLTHGNHPVKVQDGSTRAAVSSTVAKAIGILDVLASRSDTGLSLVELSSLIGMPKSSTHRYLATLQELGLAERTTNDRYCLGTRIIELAGIYLQKSDLRNDSQAIIDELADVTGETVHLAVPSGNEVVYIAKVESKHALSMSSHIGAHLPMYCTALGKAILAYSSSHEQKAILAEPLLPRTSKSITKVESLRSELDLIYSQGYAIDDEENEIGVRCVGAAIFDYTIKPIGAISVSAPCDRMDRERINSLGPLVYSAAQKVSRRKGFAGTFRRS